MINKQLAERNLRLEVDLALAKNQLTTSLPLHTEFIDEAKKRRGQKPPHMFLKYCPFCGEKYPDLK